MGHNQARRRLIEEGKTFLEYRLGQLPTLHCISIYYFRTDFDSSWKIFTRSFYDHGVIITPQFLSFTHENKSQTEPHHKSLFINRPI